MRRRTFLAGAAAVAGTGALIPVRARGDAKVKFTLPWIPHGGYTHIFVAKKLGFWEKRGLDVSVTRGHGSGKASKTVGLGQYDYGHADMGVMINAVGKGLKLASIAMVDHRSPLCIISQKDAGIKSPKDLEGKKFGQSPGSGDAVLWPAFAAANKIDVKKVNIVNMSGDLLIPSFLSKSIDAFGSFYQSSAPYLWTDKADFDILFYADHGMNMYSITHITQADRIEKKKDQVRQFIDGTMEGLKFTYLNPEESLEIFLSAVPEAGKSPREREINAHSLAINTVLGLADYVEANGLGWHKEDLVASSQDKVVKYMGLKKAAPVKSLYTNEFAGNIKLTPEEWRQTKEKVKRYLPA